MASLWESLYEQTPPSSLTETSQSTQTMPNWYQDYQKAMLQYAAKTLPTNPVLYQGNRLADLSDPATAERVQASFSPQEREAFEKIQQMQGAWQPALSTAMGMTTTAGAPTTAGTGRAYEDIGSYMSPYISNVTDRLATLAGRNLSEKLLPQISDTFIAAGQPVASRQGEFTSRALRDTTEALLAQQGELLNTGYMGALGTAQTDLARQAQIAAQNADRGLSAAGQLATLAGTGQQYGLADIAALQGVGETISGKAQQSADIAYQNFLDQRDWNLRNLGALNAALRGTDAPIGQTSYATAPSGGYGASPLAYALGAGQTAAGLPTARRGGRVLAFREGGRVPRSPLTAAGGRLAA